ncbi:Hypp7781 [Branchiostoma lanceolatum]|uniref:Hypp7781 protein n=1 Tax=Branchiostoma lanceolatum TaxID=7740 RepID=A0A8K0EBB6_BRALA|nr:Hypp7781 [Branchiostoma lanceolatum]
MIGRREDPLRETSKVVPSKFSVASRWSRLIRATTPVDHCNRGSIACENPSLSLIVKLRIANHSLLLAVSRTGR